MPDMRRLGILLVDDRAMFCETLRESLERESDFIVVGEAENADTAVCMADTMEPDVIILSSDVTSNPADLIGRVHDVAPDTRVLILASRDDPTLIQELLGHNIRGFLSRSATRVELVSAIRSICSQSSRIVLSVSQESLSFMSKPRAGGLSQRELDVLILVSQGLSNTQVATQLAIAEGTVKRHLRSVFTKLNAVSRIDAVNKAFAAELISPASTGRTRPQRSGRLRSPVSAQFEMIASDRRRVRHRWPA